MTPTLTKDKARDVTTSRSTDKVVGNAPKATPADMRREHLRDDTASQKALRPAGSRDPRQTLPKQPGTTGLGYLEHLPIFPPRWNPSYLDQEHVI